MQIKNVENDSHYLTLLTVIERAEVLLIAEPNYVDARLCAEFGQNQKEWKIVVGCVFKYLG